MAISEKTKITVEAIINAPVEKTWKIWNSPHHIIKWNAASDDWHTTHAENDLKVGGKFLTRMEAKDGSSKFDFTGEYTNIEMHKQIEYTMSDGREVQVSFVADDNKTKVTETFEAEGINPVEMQQEGWQNILNNFKKYVEELDKMEKLNYQIKIHAPVEIVYNSMLDENYYKQWTSVFMPTSYYKGSWEKGSKILFIGTDEKGEIGGMVSRIKENIPEKFVSIEHVGVLHGDKEITSGPEVEGWAGALENYSFNKDNNSTDLVVELDSNQEFKSYFEETWPKALDKLKAICENIAENRN